MDEPIEAAGIAPTERPGSTETVEDDVAAVEKRPPGERLRDAVALLREPSSRPAVILAALILLWIIVFARLAYLRHARFASFTLDMGIFDQATWLLSRMHGLFMSIRGLDFLGHHANFGLILFVPFYWLGAGPHLLNIVQVVSLGLGAVPVFLIARERFDSDWHALPLAAAYLLHPALGFFAWELFHPEAMAILPLLFAYWFAMHKRWGWFAACAIYAVSWKEDMALSVAALGIVLLFWRHRKAGIITLVASITYFELVNAVMLPTVAGGAFYNQLFGDLGNSPLDVAKTALTNPTLISSKFTQPEAKTFLWQLAAPFALLSFLAPLALFVGAPQFFIDVVSTAGFTRTITYHYAALPLIGMTLASIEAIAWISRRWPASRNFMLGMVVVSAFVSTVSWGLSPIGQQYRRGWWPLSADPRLTTKEEVIRIPPSDGSVSATYQFAPHMTHRREIYDFPNPWISNNWGVNGENLPNPNRVDWLVLDRQLLGDRDRALATFLLNGQFRIVFDRDDILVARRVERGRRPTPAELPP